MALGFRHVDSTSACRESRDGGAERIRGGLVQTDVLITQLMVPEDLDSYIMRGLWSSQPHSKDWIGVI